MCYKVMEDLAAETSTGSISACEGKLSGSSWMGVPELSIWCILHGMLYLYQYKIQALHKILTADTGPRQNFATKALTRMECNPRFFWTCGRMKPTFHCMGTWIFKTIVPRQHQTLLSTTASYCIFLTGLFVEVLPILLIWGLSLKNLVLYPTGKLVLSLRNGILHFCVTMFCLHYRKDMHYLFLPSCRMVPGPILHAASRRSCGNLSPKTKW